MIELLSLHFTDKCTRKCPGCYMRGKPGELKDPDFFMPFASIAGEMGIRQIALGGGEPTLFPEFVAEFGAACRQNGVILNMTTNGDGFNSKNINFYKDLTLVSFSIDKDKIHSKYDLESLYAKMKLAREAGLQVGVNLQLDPFIIKHLYEMLKELLCHCHRVYLLQPKPSAVDLDSELKTKLLTANSVFDHMYVDESLLMGLGLSDECGRGRRIVSVDYNGGVSCCSFDQQLAVLEEPADLISIIETHYPFQPTANCPFL